MYYSNMSLKKIVIHDINATPHWSFIKYLKFKTELFVATINSFKLLTLLKKSSILNKPVFKKNELVRPVSQISDLWWKNLSRPYLLKTIFCFADITFSTRSDIFRTFTLFYIFRKLKKSLKWPLSYWSR